MCTTLSLMGTHVVWGRLSEDQAVASRTASVPVLVLAQPPSPPAGCVGPLWAQGGVLRERRSVIGVSSKSSFPRSKLGVRTASGKTSQTWPTSHGCPVPSVTGRAGLLPA